MAANKQDEPIYYDPRWSGPHGIGRFADEVVKRIPGCHPLKIVGRKLSPIDPIAMSAALIGKRAGRFYSPGFNAPLLSRIPVFLTLHDLIHLKVPGESTWLRRAYYASVVLPAVRRATRVLTVSEYSRRDIIEWAEIPSERVAVVGNGISAAFVPEGPRHVPGYPYVLFVGRRGHHKNVPRLLEAFARARIDPTFRLLFTGRPDHDTVQRALELGIGQRVVFAGDLTDDQLAAYYRGASGLALPSLYEGFGLPIVEAMACGTPVITSAATATQEIAGRDNALFVSPTDVSSLVDAIEQLVERRGLVPTLSGRGIARAQAFCWARVAERVRNALYGESSD